MRNVLALQAYDYLEELSFPSSSFVSEKGLIYGSSAAGILYKSESQNPRM